MWPCTLPSLPLFIWDLCRPYWALPVTYPPNYEVEFEVIGVASLVSWPVLHIELCLPQDPLPICCNGTVSPMPPAPQVYQGAPPP